VPDAPCSNRVAPRAAPACPLDPSDPYSPTVRRTVPFGAQSAVRHVVVYSSSRSRADAANGGLRHRSCARPSCDAESTPSSTPRDLSADGQRGDVARRSLVMGDHTFDERTSVRPSVGGSHDAGPRPRATSVNRHDRQATMTHEHGCCETTVSETSTSESNLQNMTTSRMQQRMLSAIEWYQRTFSWRMSPCRFFPSCSSYAHEAITVHGSRRGLWLAMRRLARCRPLGPAGVDLVPPPAGSDH